MGDRVPTPGDEAPVFTGKDQDGEFSLAQLRGKKVVLFFFPEAFTGGCTTQACSLRDDFTDLSGFNAEIVGVSVDDDDTQARFREQYGLPFRVLADPDGTVANQYGVYGITRADGSVLPQARRVTFVIDEDGKIGTVIDPADPATHGQQVKDALTSLQGA